MNKEQLKEAVGELNCVDTVFETDGVSYIDTAVSVMQVYDLIDQLGELNKPLVVPKELGEWLACQELGNEGSFFSIIIELEDMWLGCDFEDFITDNKKQLIEVILGDRGYEIEKEKEKLYYVPLGILRLGDKPIYLQKTLDGLDVDWSPPEHMYRYKGNYHFTEKEIKEYDARFWPFAMEVTE